MNFLCLSRVNRLELSSFVRCSYSSGFTLFDMYFSTNSRPGDRIKTSRAQSCRCPALDVCVGIATAGHFQSLMMMQDIVSTQPL